MIFHIVPAVPEAKRGNRWMALCGQMVYEREIMPGNLSENATCPACLAEDAIDTEILEALEKKYDGRVTP